MASLLKEISPLDFEAAIQEVTIGYELMARVHSLLELASKGEGHFKVSSILGLSEEVLNVLTKALSILKPKKPVAAVVSSSPGPLALDFSLACPGAGESNTVSDAVVVIQDDDDPDEKQESRRLTVDHPFVNKGSTEKVKLPAPASPVTAAGGWNLDQIPGKKRSHLHSRTEVTYQSFNNTNTDETSCGNCGGFRKGSKSSKTKSTRNGQVSLTTTTSAPFVDGHQWRKYGEKKISNTSMPRCYYRCTFRDQGCLATKQVQQKDSDDPPMFTVTYYNQHTCHPESDLYSPEFVISSPSTNAPCNLSVGSLSDELEQGKADRHQSSRQIQFAKEK